MISLSKVATLTIAVCAVQVALPAGADNAAVRETVSKALPYIEARGQWWIDEQKCVSCHRVSFMTWALGDAQARGFDVEADRVNELRNWSRKKLLSMNEKAGKRVGELNLEAVSQIIWSERLAPPDETQQQQIGEFANMIRDGRREDGLWNAAGQLPGQKRPKRETELVSSIWSVLALDATGEQYELQRLSDALDAQHDPASSEWYAMRLLLAEQLADRAGTLKWTDALRGLQHEDGGWGWLKADESDALAAGQALYALRFAGVPKDDPAIVKAVDFLIGSQDEDGSWAVNGTKENAKDRVEETATYWGTCWAVIGLLTQIEVTGR